MSDPFRKATCWDELPEQAKSALHDLKVGETARFTVPDDANPLVTHEYVLTLTERVELTEEQYQRLTRRSGGVNVKSKGHLVRGYCCA